MKHRSLFVFCLMIATAGLAAAQAVSVTNADLESYKQARLKAEREYRENYARMGFPSPEELDRRREKSRAETEQLSAKLRTERLERERLDAERERFEAEARANAAANQTYLGTGFDYGFPGYYDPFYSTYYGGRNRRPFRGTPAQQGYFAGGQFWPTGPRTPLRPLYVPPRTPRRPR